VNGNLNVHFPLEIYKDTDMMMMMMIINWHRFLGFVKKLILSNLFLPHHLDCKPK